jgi:multidrug resistance efflux pump
MTTLRLTNADAVIILHGLGVSAGDLPGTMKFTEDDYRALIAQLQRDVEASERERAALELQLRQAWPLVEIAAAGRAAAERRAKRVEMWAEIAVVASAMTALVVTLWR